MTKQYIVLPAYGFRSGRLTQAASLRLAIPLAAVAGGQVAVANSAVDISSVSAGDPKLVEMTPETELGLEDELCKDYRHGARCNWRRDFPRPHKYFLPGTVRC